MSKAFVPHMECTVASGDCFVHGQCLRGCHFRERDTRIAVLEQRVKWLEGAVSRLTAGSSKGVA
ncbi:hypothetical protein [Cupriavidus sp. USMAA2-4]|uniref:hypothetical protein n=1 Tax=Cupriavidus sp. USMAA2-4 TaxID=876364 RepID=UPI000A5DC0C3|nr:hypothetical protein [Cupriavidus sp. USMAA2-4]